MVWNTSNLCKLNSYGISGQPCGFILSFLCNRWLQIVLDGNYWQDPSVNEVVSQGSMLVSTLFLLYISDLVDVSCNIAIYADDNTPYSKCQASDFWQGLELTSKLLLHTLFQESDPGNTMD